METDDKTMNRLIHEFLGLCWHEFPKYRAIHGDHKCHHCSVTRYDDSARNPDYCNDLNAVSKAEARLKQLALESDDLKYAHYGRILANKVILQPPFESDVRVSPVECALIATASAKQRATAIVEVLKEGQTK